MLDLMNIGQKSYTDEDFHPRLNYLSFYERILKQHLKERKYPWYITYCPFHADKNNPNLSINIINGYGKCFACGKEVKPENFILKQLDTGEFEVNLPATVTDSISLQHILEYETNHKEKPTELELAVEEARANNAHEFLFQQPLALHMLHTKRGLTTDTIKQYKLGFLHGTVTFPIYDISGNLSSLKFHKQYQTKGAEIQLYPWNFLDKSYILLVEGEFDCLLMRQLGYNAVTSTGGANSWNDEYIHFFVGKTVYIAYDNDISGKEGSKKIAEKFVKEKIDTKVIDWYPWMKEKDDHVDFFVTYGKTITDYNYLLSTARTV